MIVHSKEFMTYAARLRDITVRQSWQQANKINKPKIWVWKLLEGDILEDRNTWIDYIQMITTTTTPVVIRPHDLLQIDDVSSAVCLQ